MRKINSSFGDYTGRVRESEKRKEQKNRETADLITLEPGVIQKTRVSEIQKSTLIKKDLGMRMR